jgi:tape measure domain-containing protein
MAEEQRVSVIYEIKQMGQAVLGELAKNLNEASSQADNFKKKLEGMGKVGQAIAVGAGAVATSLGLLGKAALSAAGEVEQQRVAFKGLLGSYEAADKVIARIRKEASVTPFDTVGLTRMTQQLTTITKDGNRAVDILMSVGDAIAMSGKDVGEMERVVLNLQQVAATGKVTAMDIKQFQGAIPLFNDILAASNLTVESLQNSGNASELLFKAFEKAAKQGGIAFGGMEQQSKTLNGVVSTMKDNFQALSIQLGDGLLPIVKPIVNYINQILGNFQNLSPTLKTTIAVVGSIVFALATLLTIFGGFLAIMPAIAAGFVLWQASLAPVLLPIVGITAGVIALWAAVKYLDGVSPILSGLAIGFTLLWAAVSGGLIPIIAGIVALVGWLAKLSGAFTSLDGKMKKTNKQIEETQQKLEEAQAGGDEREVKKLEERLQQLQAKRDEYAAIKKEKEAADDEEEVAAHEAKIQKKNEIDANNKVYQDELKAIDDENKKAKEEEDMEAYRAKLLAMSEAEIAQAGYTAEQVKIIRTLKEREANEQKRAAVKEYSGFLQAAGQEEQDIGKAVAKGTLEYVKDGIKKKIIAYGEQMLFEAAVTAPLVLLGDISPILKATAGAALIAGAPAAIDTVQLADGGSMVVDTPTQIGGNVIAGEAGPERIDVTPLDQQQPQTINNYIIMDGEVIATQVLKVGQGQRAEGTLDDGL